MDTECSKLKEELEIANKKIAQLMRGICDLDIYMLVNGMVLRPTPGGISLLDGSHVECEGVGLVEIILKLGERMEHVLK